MKKFVLAIAAAALLAVPATASAGDAYGKGIQECLGDPYGIAKNAAWASGHATPPALGAKETFHAHCH